MPTSATTTFTCDRIQPVMHPHLANKDAVAIAASQTIAKGTVLGEVGNVNATSTITITAATSGGTFKLTMTSPNNGQTAAITWSGTNATLLANIQTALNTKYGTTGGAPNVVPTAVSLTAGIGTILLTAQNALAGQPITWTLQDSTTGGSGVTVASTTTGVVASGTYKAYSSTATDGTQTPKGISEYDVATDASGNVTLGGASGGGEFGQTYPTASMWIGGYFDTSELVGLDSTAVTTLGRIVEGNVAAGVLHIG